MRRTSRPATTTTTCSESHPPNLTDVPPPHHYGGPDGLTTALHSLHKGKVRDVWVAPYGLLADKHWDTLAYSCDRSGVVSLIIDWSQHDMILLHIVINHAHRNVSGIKRDFPDSVTQTGEERAVSSLWVTTRLCRVNVSNEP